MLTIRKLFNVLVNFCQGLFNWSFLTYSGIFLGDSVSAKKTIFQKSAAHIIDEAYLFLLHLLAKEPVNPQDGGATRESVIIRSRSPEPGSVAFLRRGGFFQPSQSRVTPSWVLR
jgi:hypothetical protein